MSEWSKKVEDSELIIIDGDRGSCYPKQEEISSDGYCLFLSAKNVTTKGFNFEENYFISKEKDLQLRNGKLKKNDIVLTTRGTVGNVAFYKDSVLHDNIRINSGMVIIRGIANKHYPKYFYYQFSSQLMKEQINMFATGSAQPQIPISAIKKFVIESPKYVTQKAIADILSSFDDKIENCNGIIENLNKQIVAIYKSWFFDFEPFADKIDTLTCLPQGFRNSNVYDESEEVRDKNRENREYPVLSVVNTGDFVLSEERFTKQVYSKSQSNYKIVSRNEIGFNPARANIGSIAMLTELEFGLVSPIYIVYKLKSTLLPRYFYYYMKLPKFLQSIQAQAIGTTRQNLSYSAFKLFEIVVPPLEIQQQFVGIITPLEQEIDNQKKQIKVLTKTRDELLPKLMSGEIEV